MDYLDLAKQIQAANKANKAKEPSQTVQTPSEVMRNKSEVEKLKKPAKTLDALPWQLESLLRAASSDLLPEATHKLEARLVTDLNRYTLAWAASYLTGDREEALRRLWQAHRVWKVTN